MAFGETLVRIADRVQRPRSHTIIEPPPYSPFGNVALEVEIFDRMVLGAHREPLLAQREARPAGHRPALEHAAELEPQIVMKPAAACSAPRTRRPRFARPAASARGSGEIALAGVLGVLRGFLIAAFRGCGLYRLSWSCGDLGAPWRAHDDPSTGFRRTSTPGGRAPPTASSHRPRDSAATIAPPPHGVRGAAAGAPRLNMASR